MINWQKLQSMPHIFPDGIILRNILLEPHFCSPQIMGGIITYNYAIINRKSRRSSKVTYQLSLKHINLKVYLHIDFKPTMQLLRLVTESVSGIFN